MIDKLKARYALRRRLCQRLKKHDMQIGDATCDGSDVVCGFCDITASLMVDDLVGVFQPTQKGTEAVSAQLHVKELKPQHGKECDGKPVVCSVCETIERMLKIKNAACANCRFYVDDNEGQSVRSGYGKCRKELPFRATTDSGWCGQHQKPDA